MKPRRFELHFEIKDKILGLLTCSILRVVLMKPRSFELHFEIEDKILGLFTRSIFSVFKLFIYQRCFFKLLTGDGFR